MGGCGFAVDDIVGDPDSPSGFVFFRIVNP